MATKLVNGVRFELTQTELDARQAELESYVAPVPQVVSMVQARLALLDQGLLAGVETALNALAEPAKTKALIEWEFRDTVHRNRDLVQSITLVLGLSETDIDNLFILANSL